VVPSGRPSEAVVGVDTITDLALLKIPRKGLRTSVAPRETLE
jgi:S1-C subfamily serine protease